MKSSLLALAAAFLVAAVAQTPAQALTAHAKPAAHSAIHKATWWVKDKKPKRHAHAAPKKSHVAHSAKHHHYTYAAYKPGHKQVKPKH